MQAKMGEDMAMVFQYIVMELEFANIHRDDLGRVRRNFCVINTIDIARTLKQKLNCVKKIIAQLMAQGYISVYKLCKNNIYVVQNENYVFA